MDRRFLDTEPAQKEGRRDIVCTKCSGWPPSGGNSCMFVIPALSVGAARKTAGLLLFCRTQMSGPKFALFRGNLICGLLNRHTRSGVVAAQRQSGRQFRASGMT